MFFSITIRIALASFCLLLSAVAMNAQQPARIRVAVLDFGQSPTGARAAERLQKALAADKLAAENGLTLVDRLLAAAAAGGNGFAGSLNLTTQEARDLGAAIGCDFFIIGDADTVRRSPSAGAAYFESYAAVFIVSARTGRLIYWERPQERRDTFAEAEGAMLDNLGVRDVSPGIRVAIFRAVQDESAERTSAVESPAAIIEVMSDDDNGKSDTRAPRPYRRLKPPYPEAAAQSEIEAVVDVFVDIDARGEVSKIEIARWAGYGFDQSVVDTVKQMHFFPAMRDGLAIPMRVLLRYNFQRKIPEKPAPKPLKIPK